MKLKVKAGDGSLQVECRGAIDAGVGSVLATLASHARVKRWQLNCRGITWVNSIGAAEWSQFFHRWTTHGVDVSFVECESVFVSFASMTLHFLGGGRIESFYVPGSCGCGRASFKFLSQDVQSVDDVSAARCAKCSQQAQLEVDLDTYLRFLELPS